jgi:mRNA interferase MazF
MGSGPGYARPVLVMQSDAFNKSRIQTVMVLPLTSNLRLAEAPGNVLLPARKTGLRKDSVANVSQLLTLDKDFLRDKERRLDAESLAQIEDGLKLALDL